MTDLRTAAQAMIQVLESADVDPHSSDAVYTAMAALKAALVEPVQEPDLSRCPQCGGPADNGHDRCIPPNPYWCTKCMAEPQEPPAEPRPQAVAYYHVPHQGNGCSPMVSLSPQREPSLYAASVPLYTAPPQRKPLTDEEIEKAYREIWRDLPSDFDHTSAGWIEQGIRYAERTHGVVNFEEIAK